MAAPGPKPRRFGPELEVPSLQSRDSGALYLDEGKEKGNSPSQLGTTHVHYAGPKLRGETSNQAWKGLRRRQTVFPMQPKSRTRRSQARS